MPDHYFTNAPASKRRPKEIAVQTGGSALVFETDAGVFSRGHLDEGSALLIASAPKITGRALDLGCGWGGVGVTLAHKWPDAQFTLCDINERAVALAHSNIEKNRVKNAVAMVSDGVPSGEKFDYILLNPPIRAGKEIVYRLFAECAGALNPGGALHIVIRKQQGAPSALAHLKGLFARAEVAERKGGYHIIVCTGEAE